MEESPLTPVPDLPEVEGLERLVIPTQPGSDTFVPFGNGRTSVIINRYGEVLRISKYTAEEPQRYICLTSHALVRYERDLDWIGGKLHDISQLRQTGLNFRLMPVSDVKFEDPPTGLQWINGRWPCVSYEIGGLAVTVLFTLHGDILSQQYLIANHTEDTKPLRYALQIGDADVNTLSVRDSRYVLFQASLQSIQGYDGVLEIESFTFRGSSKPQVLPSWYHSTLAGPIHDVTS